MKIEIDDTGIHIVHSDSHRTHFYVTDNKITKTSTLGEVHSILVKENDIHEFFHIVDKPEDDKTKVMKLWKWWCQHLR